MIGQADTTDIPLGTDGLAAPSANGPQIPPPRPSRPRSTFRQWIAPPLIGSSIAILGVAAWATINFDSPRDALRYVQGVRLVVEPRVIDFGEAAAGEVRDASFVVRNLANEPITNLGASPSCNCTTNDRLPSSIPANGSHRFRIKLRFEGEPAERIEQSVKYFTDSARHRGFLLRIIGKVRS